MRANRGRSSSIWRRLVGAAAAFALLGLLAPAGARADIKGQLDRAKARLEQLKREIAHQYEVVKAIESRAAAVAARLLDAKDAYDQITAELNRTRDELARASERYTELRDRLNARAREAYMQGAGSPIEFLLSATSFADLTDRVEYVDAVTQSDADLANQVQNLKNDLSAKERDQQRLQERQAQKLNEIQTQQAQVDAELAQAKRVYDDIQRKKDEAARLVEKLGKQYRNYLQSLYNIGYNPNGVFKVCPVGQPHILTDSFGAPRYAGGFHLHAGNDIMAPMGTPILAPFDGTARSSSNGLGGLAEYVYGPTGYVYNAHLSAYSASSNGPVHAGDVIGYVGNTGDAAGGPTHDHFEWHPNQIPSNWPASPYGYSVIGSAVNPYPLLSQVC